MISDRSAADAAGLNRALPAPICGDIAPAADGVSIVRAARTYEVIPWSSQRF